MVKIRSSSVYRPRTASSADALNEEALVVHHRVEYIIDDGGTRVQMANEVEIKGEAWDRAQLDGDLKTLPRVGLLFEVEHESRIAYHGRGPHENYADRACG